MRKCLVVFMMLPLVGQGQEADTLNKVSPSAAFNTIPQVTVLAQVYTVPAKSSARLKSTAPLLHVVSGLNLIPGVSAQEGAVNTAKFSYRGFGARSQYTTSRTLFYLDEIPITTLQGFSTFEDINPQYVSSAALMGQVNGMYPSALGSVVQLRSSIWPSSINWANQGGSNNVSNIFTVGSFGLVSENAFYTNEGQGLTVAYENTQRKGWRENSAFERQSFYLNGKRLLGKNLQLLVYGIQNRSEIPSSLSLENFENDPERAAESWGRINGYEQYDKLITGITYRNYPDFMEVSPEKVQFSSTVFYQYRNGFEPRPFNILDDESHQGGVRATAVKHFSGKVKSRFTAFMEYHIGTDNASTFENLYDSLNNTYNKVGAAINSTNIFTQRLNAGAAFSSGFSKRDSVSTRFGYELSLNGYYQTNRLNTGVTYGVPLNLAPAARISYTPHGARKAVPFFSVYSSYSIPSVEENLNPDGSLNPGLKPETAWTAELGLDKPLRLSWSSKSITGVQLHWKPNLYYSEVKNLIVPKVVGPDQVVATNSGSSRHTGVEMGIGLYEFRSLWDPSKAAGERNRGYVYWELNMNGYYGYFAYKNFSDTTGNYSRNRLPGFPEWQGTLSGEVSYERDLYKPGSSHEFTLGLQAQATGGHYINDQNTVRNEPYFLLQTWLGYQHSFEKHWMLNVKGGIKNLTKTKYAGMTVVNNTAFDNTEPRYYYPGEPINWFCSFNVAYRF